MTSTPDLLHMKIDSPLCKILPYHIFEVALLQNAARADRRNADTPLVLENTAASNGFWAMQNLTSKDDFVNQAHAANISSGEASFEQISESMGCEVESRMHCVDETLVRLQDRYVQHLNTIGELDAMQQSKLYKKTKQENLPRLQLPPHTRVQNVNFPTTRSDLREMLRMNSQRICIAMGVPPELLIKDHHVKLDEGQSQEVALQRVAEIRKILQPILTEAFSQCTKGDDFILSLLTGKKRFSIIPEITIQPHLPKTEDLVKLHQLDLLPVSYLRKHLAKKYDFDVSEYDASPPPAKAKKVTEKDGPGRADRRGDAEASGTPEE